MQEQETQCQEKGRQHTSPHSEGKELQAPCSDALDPIYRSFQAPRIQAGFKAEFPSFFLFFIREAAPFQANHPSETRNNCSSVTDSRSEKRSGARHKQSEIREEKTVWETQSLISVAGL